MDPSASDSVIHALDIWKSQIILVRGNIAQFKGADVLVNTVTDSNIELKSTGEIPKAFYEIGEDLQKKYAKAGQPKTFGTDLTITEPAGKIQAKKVFHPMIDGYRGNESLKLLTRMIKICLEKAESEHLTSIAFPTLGCGKLRYSVSDVAKCFLEAAKGTKIQIFIVAFTEQHYEKFKSSLESCKETARGSLALNETMVSSINRNKDVINRRKNLCGTMFPICDDDQHSTKPFRQIDEHKGTLNQPSSSADIEMPIFHSAIARLKPEFAAKIQDFQSDKVKINIDINQSTVTLVGNRSSLDEAKQRLLDLLAEVELRQKRLSYIKCTEGVKEYLILLAQKESIRFPHYWKNSTFPDLSKSDLRRCLCTKGSELHDAVTNFVMNTWNSSQVGHGIDAKGLIHSKIAVKNIWTIENPHLFTNYQFKLKALAMKAAHKPFKSISEFPGEQEPLTQRISGVNYLNSQLISELNEVYLFHGSTHVDEIVKNGIDCRFSGNRVLFGRGAYFGESSTKSDQYSEAMMNPVSTDSAVIRSIDQPLNVIVTNGSIVEFKEADVLVNPVTSATVDLRSGGEVSKSFYEMGKEELQKEYAAAGPPEWFGVDVTVTRSVGSINAKKIFHPAIGRYHNKKSLKLLTNMLVTCLKRAELEQMSSIAFPTVGCGKLGYSENDVAECFLEASRETDIQIYIVAYTEELYKKFTKFLSATAKSDKQSVNLSAESQTVSPSADRQSFDFRKTLLNRNSSIADVDQAPIEISIFHSTVAELDQETVSKIHSLASDEVHIKIDIDQSAIALTGIRGTVQDIRQRILKLLAEDELKRKNLSYIKSSKGVKEYLLALSRKKNIRFPQYWTNSTFSDLSKAVSTPCRLLNGSQVYDAVAAFVLNTWISSLATYGRDARGLAHSEIAVKNIWTIENPLLFTNYQFKLKALALKAAHKPFTMIAGLFGEPEIMTKRISGVDYLNGQLISEVNEVYLLHGSSHVSEIVKSGIDCRFSGDRVLFGRGAYFAESSTKSDQYADQNRKRRNKDDRLCLFVARVLLGEPFLSQESRPELKKAPCSTMGCKKDTCSDSHPMCDSVIGTHSKVSTPLLFREFIVYHPEQCYPEFLVEYERL